ncbi:MAG: sucrose phosphorylase [Desulfobacteraceae bacterium]|jgi:sucrose phosphorylase|nr:sucrose phosphorylase [Desulfobacteraceae bacterium]
MTLHNKIQIISYPDSLGKNLQELHYVLNRYFSKAVGGVHILPFYPSSADRGFAPISYYDVDPAFGTWEDLEIINDDYNLIFDFMVNHISRQSKYFIDFLENGQTSEFADMFLSFSKLNSDGHIRKEDLEKVYTRKPRPPFQEIQRPDGSMETIWCTFDFEQIDVDIKSHKTKELFRDFLIFLSRKKPLFIRMDAIAYTTVEIGTNCFFLEPEIWDTLEMLNGFVSPFGVSILPEVHAHYSYQLKLAEKGYWVYDFSLPMLVLHTLYHHSNKRLLHWLKICPRRQITTLDTHDGIGVVDVEDLMTPEEIEKTINGLYEKGSTVKPIYSSSEYQNLDVYQVNCTYYSALEKNDDAYIAARTIQFFTPGIPQVYYVGLLAGENDIALVEETKNGRDINRHSYHLDEIHDEIRKPVVQRLIKLMEFRNHYPAFDGDLTIEDSPENQLILTYSFGKYSCTATIDLVDYSTEIRYFEEKTNKIISFIA